MSDFAIKAKSDMMFLASLEIYGEVLFGMFDCKCLPFLTHECAHVQERVIAICDFHLVGGLLTFGNVQ